VTFKAAPVLAKPLAMVGFSVGEGRHCIVAVPPWLTPEEEAGLQAEFGDEAFEMARGRWVQRCEKGVGE